MRGLCVAALVVVGCGEPEPMSPHDEYNALEARVTSECGTYERNYSPDPHNPIAEHLCGDAPNVGCMNDAISGSAIAKLTYTYYDSRGLFREQNYYAGDGVLAWIGYYERVGDETNWWYWADCTTLVAEPYELLDQTCWNLKSTGCVAR
jgi:hypothetical protein